MEAKIILNKIIKYIRHPTLIILKANHHGIKLLPDAAYLKLQFKHKMGYRLNLKAPKTFNEKLNWLKLYDRKLRYTQMCDKYAARKYIADKVGTEYTVPLLGVWDRFDDINFGELPNQFVIKCNHDSGSVIICENKDNLDMDAARKKLSEALRRNFYLRNREWCYKNVKPKIIAEKYLGDNITDYKVHCFNGRAKFVQVAHDRFISKINNMYMLPNWDFVPVHIGIKSKVDAKRLIHCPTQLSKMIEISENLALAMPYLRVDLYCINDDIYVGELSFSSGAGYLRTNPDMSAEWGEWITLPDKR